MSQAQFSLPDTEVSKDLIERVQFSVSSRNASSKVSECLTHVFVSPYCDDPTAIAWQYVSSGVTCLLRKKEQAKNVRKMVWTVHMCLYNVTYGVLVWKGAIAPNSCYTAVADNFHVYVMHELNAVVGLLFDETSQAREFLRSYLQWDAEKVKEERSKGEPSLPAASRFGKEMISKPCNFQHIQGTQALDECMEIERIKTDIQAAFFGLGPTTRVRRDAEYRSKGSSSGKRKKDVGKPRIQFQNISVPHKMHTSTSDHMLVQASKSLDVDMVGSVSPLLKTQGSVPMEMGLRHSMPPQLAVHQSQPDLLNGYQSEYIPSRPAVPLSPQYESLPRYNRLESQVSNQPQTVSPPHSPLYDKLTLELQSLHMVNAPLKNGSGSHSPAYDSVPHNGADPHSPLYDSLQKIPHAPGPSIDHHTSTMQPQLSDDAIVDNEVAGYSAASQGSERDILGHDYTPPERLSPLNFEKEFSQSAFFHPAFVTSTTNC